MKPLNGTREGHAVLPLHRWRHLHHVRACKSLTSACYSQRQQAPITSTATLLIASDHAWLWERLGSSATSGIRHRLLAFFVGVWVGRGVGSGRVPPLFLSSG